MYFPPYLPLPQQHCGHIWFQKANESERRTTIQLTKTLSSYQANCNYHNLTIWGYSFLSACNSSHDRNFLTKLSKQLPEDYKFGEPT